MINVSVGCAVTRFKNMIYFSLAIEEIMLRSRESKVMVTVYLNFYPQQSQPGYTAFDWRMELWYYIVSLLISFMLVAI